MPYDIVFGGYCIQCYTVVMSTLVFGLMLCPFG